MSAEQPRQTPRTLWRIFRSPFVLAVVSVVGLIGALLTDGPVDLAWSAVVAAPLVVIGWRLAKP